jgi:uncharacterized protein (TIGR03067 family)
MTGHVWLLLTGALTVGFDNADLTKKDLARLAGVWSFALVEVDGNKQPDVPFATNKMILTKEGNYAVVQGLRVTRGTLKLNPATDPKHYDPTIATGRLKGLTVPGIYELDGDTLRLCFPLRSKGRPAVLASKPGSGLLFQVFKREKQEVKEGLIEAGRVELAGTWQSVSYSLDGNKAPDEDLKKVTLSIDADGKASARRDGQVFIASTLKIDPNSAPMTVDVTFTEGDAKGRTALGIYKIEDDVLTLCRAAPDKARPAEFSSKPGSGHTLMTYRREKARTK